MRLDQIKIGSSKSSSTHQFKNLKDVTIDFDDEHWVTVIIGWNGTGKSNVLEALTLIFRDLIMEKRTPEFAFILKYRMGSKNDLLHIEIDADPDRVKDPFIFYVATDSEACNKDLLTSLENDAPTISARRGKRIPLGKFFKGASRYLPRYVFSYYSGESKRMYEIFRPYIEKYDSDLRAGKNPGMKRLFYALPVHSQFVLLAFLIKQAEDVQEFLREHLGIDPESGIESVLFVLSQPPWTKKRVLYDDGDPRFWNARGIVKEFLQRLFEIALAPIEIKKRISVSLWNKETMQFKYLFVKNIQALRKLVGDQPPSEFFRDLESTHVSQLISEVRIRIKTNNKGNVTFKELSEGEQQLLTVIGLLRFTAESESIFLLDEPDTHLNPRWCVDYIHYLKQFVKNTNQNTDTSHIVLTTHNPLAIAELEKEQIQILQFVKHDRASGIIAIHPEMDPKGMGYAAIVTSDMFGIASSLDRPTQLLLEEQRIYASKEHLTSGEQQKLDVVNLKLDNLGFRFFHPDDEYSRYLRLRNEMLSKMFESSSPDYLAQKTLELSRDEREALAKRLIDIIVNDRNINDSTSAELSE